MANTILVHHCDDEEGRWEYAIYLDINHLDTMYGAMRLNLCVQSHSILSHGMQGYHLTSDPDYIEWLTKHGESLTLIPAENWYEEYPENPRYFREFQLALKKCHKFGMEAGDQRDVDPNDCQPAPDMSEVIDDEKGLIDNPEMDDWDRDRLEYDTTQKHVENLRGTLITCESVGEISTGEVNMWVDVELKVTLNTEVPLPDDEDLDMDRFRPKGFTVFRVKGDHCIILWDRAEIEYEMMVNRFKATMPDLDPLDFVYFE